MLPFYCLDNKVLSLIRPLPTVALGHTLTIFSQDYFNTFWTPTYVFTFALVFVPFCNPFSIRLLNILRDKPD